MGKGAKGLLSLVAEEEGEAEAEGGGGREEEGREEKGGELELFGFLFSVGWTRCFVFGLNADCSLLPSLL